jgi:DNA-binding NarL/FixJ family response regulator
VCRGDSYFSPPVASRLTAAVQGEHNSTNPVDQLTSRELEVLRGVVQGHTSKQIAGDLGISHRTVETHRESVMRKLKIRSVAELTRFAIETGIIPT